MHRRDLVQAAINRMELSEQDLAEVAGWKGAAKGVTKARDRTGWAITYSNKAGWLKNASRGKWELTPEGHRLIETHPTAIPNQVYTNLLAQVRDERAERKRIATVPPPGGECVVDVTVAAGEELSPEEAIQAAYARLRDDISAVLLSNLRAAEPAFLERTIVELLGAMGYGADEDALEVTGGTGDAGIDGIVRLDKLGLEHIYVEAKRHDANNTVQRKDIQASSALNRPQRH
jgi:restriction system protein